MLRLPSSTLPTAALTLLPPIGHEPNPSSPTAIYWLSTVRADGRPHVTPVIAVWREGDPLLHWSRRAEVAQPGRQLERRRHDGEERMGRARRRRRGRGPADHRRRCTAQPGGSLGGQVRQGLALRRRRRGLPPRCRHGRRLRGGTGEGVRLRPRRAGRRHPLPVLIFCPSESPHNDRYRRTEGPYRDRDGRVDPREGRVRRPCPCCASRAA